MYKGSTHQGRIVGQLLSICMGVLLAGGVHAATQTRTSAFEYDPATGLLTKEVIEPDNSNLCLVTTYTYDAYGNKTAATTRNCNGSTGEAPAPTGAAVIASRTTSSTYDTRGQFPLTSSNALNQSETRTYDPKFGTVTSLTGPNGLTTTWQYDTSGRKVLEIRADGTRTAWEYEYCSGTNGGTASCPTLESGTGSWRVTATPQKADGTQNGPRTLTYYDSLNREIRSGTEGFDGAGVATMIYKDTVYDSLGRVSKVTRPRFSGQAGYWTTIAYDAIGRPVSQTDPDGKVTSTAYNGLTTIITNPNNQKRTTTKNSQGQIVSIKDASNQTVTYAYDPFGNLTRTTDHLGNVVALSYDLRGRKTSMADPDMGNWTYVYDALGQLVSQTDAKTQTTTIEYDKLGRMTQRLEPNLKSNWYYDTGKGGASCPKGIGKLCQAETDTGYERTHSYDTLGRPQQTTTTLGAGTGSARSYTASVAYDTNGRVAVQTYPGGVATKYVYTTLGYTKEVRDNASNALYWTANTIDAEGRILQQAYGNGVPTTQTYDAQTGRLMAISAGAGGSIQNVSYTYDAIGNMMSRNDGTVVESFLYDPLNRLTTATVSSGGAGLPTTSYTYNAIGNIINRSDVGAYTYNASGGGSVRPHALTRLDQAGGAYRTYQYDANGNLNTEAQFDAANVQTGGRTQTWTSFNMPEVIAGNGFASSFAYGPEHQRVYQTSSSASGTTDYINPGNEGGLLYEKDSKADGSIEQRSFITAGGSVIAVVKQITNAIGSTTSTRYFHRDNLGSTSAVTDEAGAVVEQLAYEPFGKRRFTSGLLDPNNTIHPVTTERGFTNHEHMDELGLIHMNGRIYDPLTGRFTSADPIIQDPYSLQSYNRYSYCSNNPMICTDPSGYSWLSKTWKKVWNSSVGRIAVSVGAGMIVGPWVSGWVQGMMQQAAGMCFAATPGLASVAGGAAGGFAGGLAGSGGDFKSGFTGALSGGLFSAAGMVGAADDWGRYLGHAGAGCVDGALGGNGCGPGAASAVAGKWFTNNVPGGWEDASRAVASIVAGGTASVIGGGRFANGALTASYGYLFNYLVSDANTARQMFNSGAKAGHHWIPFGSLVGFDVSEDALRYWGQAKSGATVAGDHIYDGAHQAYNKAVRAELQAYVKQHGINIAEMTVDQARAFTNHVLSGSSSPAIRGYVTHISESVATRAIATMGQSQLGRASMGFLRFISGAGATLGAYSGDLH